MRIAWELFINLFEVCIIYDFLIRYLGYRTENKSRYIETVFWGIVSFTAISVPSLFIPLEAFSTLLSVCVNYIFCVRLLNGKKLEKAFLSVFVMALVAVAAVLGISLFGRFIGEAASELITEFSLNRVAAMIFAKVLLIWFTRIALRWKTAARLTFSDGILLFFVPLFSIVAMFLLWSIAIGNSGMEGMVLVIIAMIAVMDILVYILFKRISTDNQVKQEYALLRLQYDCIENTSQETQHIYEEMQSVRHDLKNHLQCIDRLAAEQKCNEIHRYIQDFLWIEKEKEHTIVFTDNHILDTILNIKISAAEQQGICCTVIITYSNLQLSQSDICVLFGNLMDNAMEAAMQTKDKKIDIRIAKQGEYAYICIQNSISNSILSENPQLKTSKTNKKYHGFGLRNIKKIVAEYGGVITFDEIEQRFICDILIPPNTKLERKTTKLGQSIEK